MAVSGNTGSLPEGALQLVTKKDYKRNSRVISESARRYTLLPERWYKSGSRLLISSRIAFVLNMC